MHECDMIVARDNVAERGEALLDALEGDSVWEGIAKVLELLVRRRRGYKEAVTVAGSKMAMCVPPMEVRTTGMTSPSSASNTE
jgi:hypothetical protein